MRKSLFVILVSIYSLALVACGENVSATTTPEQEEVVTEDITTEYNGEGAGQGVIKSDDELEALEAEASEYSSGEDYDTYVIESKEEVKETTEYEKPWYGPLGTSDYKAENYPYCPADDYWVNDTQFDIVSWIKANGGSVYYYSSDGERQKEVDETTIMYKFSFDYSVGSWAIITGSTYGFDLSNEHVSGEGFMYTSAGDSELISLNQYECYTYKDVIDALDNTVKQIKERPEGPINEPSIN